MDNKACTPPKGQTYLTIGQDLFAVDEYIRDTYSFTLQEYLKSNLTKSPAPPKSAILPAAAMVYTDIQTIQGLNNPINYGSGIEYADGLLQQGVHALQIGLWLNGTAGCRDIVEGNLDENLEHLQKYLARTSAQHVFLRVGYEFDNPAFGYDDPAVFRKAYRKLVDHSRNLEWKVDFVWHSWGAGSGYDKLWEYYPGPEYVDWVGVSLFTQVYPNSTTGSIETVKTVLDFASDVDKPIMIAESTPYGGIDSLADPWADWFLPVLDLIDNYDIAMWSYINCNWKAQAMWQDAGFGDTRLAINETVQKLWLENVLQNNRFLLSSQTWWWNGCRQPGGMLLLGSLTYIRGISSSITTRMSLLCVGLIAIVLLKVGSPSISKRRSNDQKRFMESDQHQCSKYGSVDDAAVDA